MQAFLQRGSSSKQSAVYLRCLGRSSPVVLGNTLRTTGWRWPNFKALARSQRTFITQPF